jgi:hypothetical protein
MAQPGDILVVTPTSPCDDGYFGELLATSLVAHGVRGLVIDAGVRDVAELTEMGFRCGPRPSVRKAPSRRRWATCKRRSSAPAPTYRPGDVIVADDDGVVVVAREERRRRCSPHRPGARGQRADKRSTTGEREIGARHLRDAREAHSRASTTSTRPTTREFADGHSLLVYPRRDLKGSLLPRGDLPGDVPTRDAVLLAAMGSPDVREIDGMGGGHPADVQGRGDQDRRQRDDATSTTSSCRSGPTALKSRTIRTAATSRRRRPFRARRGLDQADGDASDVRIWMENTQSLAVARVRHPTAPCATTVTPTSTGSPVRAVHPHRVPRRRGLDVRVAASNRSRRRRHRRGCASPASTTACRSCACKAEDVGLTGYEEPRRSRANARCATSSSGSAWPPDRS